jgi:hypothetical protein
LEFFFGQQAIPFSGENVFLTFQKRKYFRKQLVLLKFFHEMVVLIYLIVFSRTSQLWNKNFGNLIKFISKSKVWR